MSIVYIQSVEKSRTCCPQRELHHSGFFMFGLQHFYLLLLQHATAGGVSYACADSQVWFDLHM